MKVLMLTYGTRGDIQPFIALSNALAKAGHEVLLGAPSGATELAESYDVPIFPFGDPYRTLPDDVAARDTVKSNSRVARRAAKLVTNAVGKARPMISRLLNDMTEVAKDGADIVVHHAAVPGNLIAEWLCVPSVPVCPQLSWVPTDSFPNPRFPVRLPPAFNRVSYMWTDLEVWAALGRTAEWRRQLGLPLRRGKNNVLRGPDGKPTTVLQAFSRHVLPTPLNYPNWVHTTGFWYLPAPPEWTPDTNLSEFIEAGEPPVYIGFGSMTGTDPHRTGCVVAEAIRRAGVRAVVATGWGGITPGQMGNDVYCLEDVPQDWLFPRMAAIVHHGGAGTISAALASGRPQIVCPFITDQPFNARRMYASGVAPAPLPQRKLSSDGLASAMRRAATDRAMLARARELGHSVRAEEGVRTAVELLEASA